MTGHVSWSPDYRSGLGSADHKRHPLDEAMRDTVRADELEHLFGRLGELSRHMPGKAAAHVRQAMVELEKARRAGASDAA